MNFYRKFRTRETRDTGVDLENLAIVGEQVFFFRKAKKQIFTQDDGLVHYPTLTHLGVVSGSNSATVSWATPECFPRFEIAVAKVNNHPSFPSCILLKIGGRVRGRGELQGRV